MLSEIQDYITSKNLEYDITKEYHELRLNWINVFAEGVGLETKAWELMLHSIEAVDKSLQFDKRQLKMGGD